jgi:hypothetical protein
LDRDPAPVARLSLDGWNPKAFVVPAIQAMASDYSGDAGFFTRSFEDQIFLENGIIGTEFV